jgi:hypothetical protein
MLLALLILAMLLSGCVSKSAYEELQTERDAVLSQLATLQAEHNALLEVYPPRDFSSLAELQQWLLQNDVSEQPASSSVEEMYTKGLVLQQNAIEDGYLISVDFEIPYPFFYFVYGVAIIDGDIWLWEVEMDEPFKAQNWDKVK